MTPKKGPGRPSALTPARRTRVERELAAGATVEAAAQRVGVTKRTLMRWLAAGKVTRPGVPPPPVVPTGQSLAERLEQAEPGLVAAVIQAAQRGSWQAAAWMLERSFPERWGRRDGSTVVAAPSKDQFAEIDELAGRRRSA